MVSLEFFIDLILLVYNVPGFGSASYRNEYWECLLREKAAGVYG